MISNDTIDKHSIGTVIGNKYRLQRLITKGTFSAVYECEHVIKKTMSVIKLETNETAKKLMRHEVDMYMALQKSKVRIPKIKNTGTDGDIQYIILERLNQSLKEYKGHISYTELYQQLYLLHNESILHRDIKPDNFVMGFDRKIYMIDLGLSKVDDGKTTKGFVGNYRYASPTCFEPIYIYTKKDDIVSITFMLLDLKYGYLPWDYEGFDKNRGEINLSRFYPNEPLCEMLNLGDDYDQIFKLLKKCIL